MSDSFELRNPDNFVAGTVGEPGERIFFIQAVEENLVVTLKCEKGQVQALASYLAEVLEDRGLDPQPTPVTNMSEPPIAAWTIGGLAIGVEPNNDAIVVIAQELADDFGDESPDDGPDPADAHIHLTPGQAKGFIAQALFLVEYGRDFGRQNGHRPIGD
ncbi:MAG: DUF3090 family protein [Actinomycetota bacterium]|jgi:uncharacterized repeat protein (TIGR03847 family)|nr:DUF3090 family protein [Actinomycetota bacterium]